MQTDHLIIEDTIPYWTADTLQSVAALPSRLRMEGILMPSIPSTESWVGWVLFGLLGLLISSWLLDPNAILNSTSFSFKIKERESIFKNSTLTNLYARICFLLFVFGTFGLVLYLYVYNLGDNFTAKRYGSILMVVTAFYAVKYALFILLKYVFAHYSKEAGKAWIVEYFRVISAYCLFQFPLIVLCIYGIPIEPSHYTNMTMLISLLPMCYLTIRLVQFFLLKKTSLLYIMLYLCTFEIIPFLAMVHILKIVV